MANGKRMRGESHSDAQMPPSTSSWASTRKARSASGVAKTEPSKVPNRTIWFPRVRPIPLQPGARLTNDFRLRHGEIQKVGIVINEIIIWRLTSWLGGGH
jgi:hypothetical protein